jgi:hypothetical protein
MCEVLLLAEHTKMPFRTSGRYSPPIEVWSRVVIQDYATKLFCRQWPPLRVPIKNYACLGKTILSCRVVLRFSVGFSSEQRPLLRYLSRG